MGNVVKQTRCPRCASRGQDTRGNNLSVYADAGEHCWSCGYHRNGKFQLTFVNKETTNDTQKGVLPFDFVKSPIPAKHWKWLLQYGLPYTYWQPYCGYSESADRLILTYGNPVQFAQGRSQSMDSPKWVNYGTRHTHVETLGKEISGPVSLVEDLISAHKVAQVSPAIPLFGTVIFDKVIKELRDLNRPVVLWLDADQYQLLPPKVNRLQSLLKVPVTYLHTRLDPKEYSLEEIKEYLNDSS